MLPLDSVTLPLKTAAAQMEMDLQRAKALFLKKQKGTLTQEEVDKVKAHILK